MSGLHESCICPEESSLAGALSGGHSQSAVSGGPRQGRHGCKAHSRQSCQSFSTGYALYQKNSYIRAAEPNEWRHFAQVSDNMAGEQSFEKPTLTFSNAQWVQMINNAMLTAMRYLYQHPTFTSLGFLMLLSNLLNSQIFCLFWKEKSQFKRFEIYIWKWYAVTPNAYSEFVKTVEFM